MSDSPTPRRYKCLACGITWDASQCHGHHDCLTTKTCGDLFCGATCRPLRDDEQVPLHPITEGSPFLVVDSKKLEESWKADELKEVRFLPGSLPDSPVAGFDYASLELKVYAAHNRHPSLPRGHAAYYGEPKKFELSFKDAQPNDAPSPQLA